MIVVWTLVQHGGSRDPWLDFVDAHFTEDELVRLNQVAEAAMLE